MIQSGIVDHNRITYQLWDQAVHKKQSLWAERMMLHQHREVKKNKWSMQSNVKTQNWAKGWLDLSLWRENAMIQWLWIMIFIIACVYLFIFQSSFKKKHWYSEQTSSRPCMALILFVLFSLLALAFKMIFPLQIPRERTLPTHRKYFIEPLKNQWFERGWRA